MTMGSQMASAPVTSKRKLSEAEEIRLMDYPDSTEEIPLLDMSAYLRGEPGGRERVRWKALVTMKDRVTMQYSSRIPAEIVWRFAIASNGRSDTHLGLPPFISTKNADNLSVNIRRLATVVLRKYRYLGREPREAWILI